MIGASVTVKLSPQAFDLVREALTEQHELSKAFAMNEANDPKARSHARMKAMQFDALLRQLNT